MATSLYAEIESDLRLRGDYLLVDGTLEVDGKAQCDAGLTVTGTVTCTTLAGLTAPTVAGGLTLSSPTVTTTKTLTISSKMTTHSGVTVGAPTGTDAGLAWTSGAPVFSDGQKYVVLTCGSTDYRIPVWLNA